MVSAHTQMVHTRVMDLLCREDRNLIADSFDQSGRFLAKGKTGDVRKDRALWRYGKLWDKLDKWLKKRSKNGLVGFSVPTFIWLQPDLTTTEKLLLADVWHLENAKLRCFKENLSFAIELGLSAASVANIISELTKAGFLKPRTLEGDKWYLSLGDALSGQRGGAVNKAQDGSSENEGGVHRKMKGPSSEDEPTVIGKGGRPHRKMSGGSLSDEQAQAPNREETPANIEDSEQTPGAKVQGKVHGTVQKAQSALRTTTSSIRAEKPPGAAGGRPITPDGVNHKLCGPVSELDPAIATTDELLAALPSMNKDDVETVLQNHEAVSLLKFWLANYGRLFGKKPRFTPADILAALDLVQCGMEVRDLIAAIIRAWMEPISTDPDSHNPYWACNHYSRSLADLAKTNSGQDKSNFDRMLVEMGWRGYAKQVEKSYELLAGVPARS